ncbi:MAG: hypothetical protein M1830_006422 [Pleopsidium flavum]|nr:MAG: hypothetical protein M1830_006422 [Pleopsidium flavum]
MFKRFSSTFRKGRPRDEKTDNGHLSSQKAGLDPTAKSSALETQETDNTHHSVKREEVQSSFQQYAQLVHAVQRPLPTQSGDGSYLEQDVPASMMQDLRSLGFKDVKTLMAVKKTKASGALVDDKTYLMEYVIQRSASSLKEPGRPDPILSLMNSGIRSSTHPSRKIPRYSLFAYMGDKFTYRQADGSCNVSPFGPQGIHRLNVEQNIMFPHLGAANTSYARSVHPGTLQPSALPDPGMIVDSVFARTEFTPHPNNVSRTLAGLSKWEHDLSKDPSERPFAHLQRGADGKFSDDDLVKIMTESKEDTAGTLGNGIAALYEFRKFFGLKPHKTFEDINSDPQVADQLRHLYEHPGFVEMYPGIVAEEAKVPMVPRVRIAPTFTISRAILSDAVVLVDYHRKNLTNSGYSEVQYDFNVEQGCVLYKLFLRTFPNHFKSNSAYAHSPVTIPSENKKILASLGRESHHTWDRPALIPPRVNLTSYMGAKYILEHATQFKSAWGEGFEWLMSKGGLDFMLSGVSNFHTQQRKLMGKALYRDQWHQQVKDFYEFITLKLLREK